MIERRRLVRDRAGRIRLRLPAEERQVLAAVAAELAARLEEVGGAGGPDEIRPLRGEGEVGSRGGEGESVSRRVEGVPGAGGPDEIRPLRGDDESVSRGGEGEVVPGAGGPDEIRAVRGDAGVPGARALPVDLVRLFPPAHAEDLEAEREYRRLVGDELLDGKRESLRVFVASLERDELAEEELEAWLRVLNDLRLVLGTRLDVDEETYARPLDARDPDAPELALFGYLSWLQEQAVEAAAAGFPGR